MECNFLVHFNDKKNKNLIFHFSCVNKVDKL